MLKWIKSHRWWLTYALTAAIVFGTLGVRAESPSLSQGQPSIALGTGETVITLGSTAEAAGACDYVFDGAQDNVQFLAALNALPATGGRLVIVSATTLSFAATVTRAIPNVTIDCTGAGTYFTYNGVNPIFTAGGNGWTFIGLRTDAGGLNMGATTGWVWSNVTVGATQYVLRTPNTTTLGTGDITTTSISAPTGRTATYVIAASDAPAIWKAQADYLMPGDQATLLASMEAGGDFYFAEGTYTWTAAILPSQTVATAIRGAGSATVFNYDSSGAFNGYLIGRHWTGNTIVDLTVSNLKVVDTRATPAQSYAVFTGWTPGATTCSNIVVDGVEAVETGIWIANVTTGKAVIKNSYVHDQTTNDRAIGINWSNDGYIINNLIKNVSQMGIGSPGNTHLTVTGNIVLATDQSTAGAFAIDVSDSSNVMVVDNNVAAPSGILSENSPGIVTISNNILSGSGATIGTGIQVYRTGVAEPQATEILVANNQMTGYSVPISVMDEALVNVVNNTAKDANRGLSFSKNAGWGIEPTMIRVQGNICLSIGKEAYQPAMSTGNLTAMEIMGNTFIGDGIANTFGIRWLNAASRLLDNYFYNFAANASGEWDAAAVSDRNVGVADHP